MKAARQPCSLVHDVAGVICKYDRNKDFLNVQRHDTSLGCFLHGHQGCPSVTIKPPKSKGRQKPFARIQSSLPPLRLSTGPPPSARWALAAAFSISELASPPIKTAAPVK